MILNFLSKKDIIGITNYELGENYYEARTKRKITFIFRNNHTRYFLF